MLKCLECGNPLTKIGENYCCSSCLKKYSAYNGIVRCMIELGEEEKDVAALYNRMNRLFNNSSLGRFVSSINQGYVSSAHYQICRRGINNVNTALYREILKDICIEKKVILDVGCGRGGFLSYLRSLGKVSFFIGMDISYEGLLLVAPKEDILLINASYNKIPLLDKKIDCVFSIETNILTSEKAVEEVYRVLDTGGQFIIADFIQNDMIRSVEQRLRNSFEIKSKRDITQNVILAIEEKSNNWSNLAKQGFYTEENAGTVKSSHYQKIKSGEIGYYIYSIIRN